jgi:hypothetical protein
VEERRRFSSTIAVEDAAYSMVMLSMLSRMLVSRRMLVLRRMLVSAQR